MSGRLIAWLTLVGVQIAISYAARATSGKPKKDAVYHWSLSINAIVQYVFILGIVVAIVSPEFRARLGLRRPESWPRAAWAGGGVLVALIVLAQASEPLLHSGREQGLEPSGWIPGHTAAFVASFVAIAVVAPIVEELTFRGAGYDLLSRWGSGFAIVATGLLFGLAHGLVNGLPILTAFGIGVAWLRVRTKSVYPGMVLHGLFNGVALVLAVAH